MRSVTGSLSEFNGMWHAHISYYDNEGKRRRKSRTTGLKATKRNRKQAQVILDEMIHEYRTTYCIETVENLYFEDLLKRWLQVHQNKVRENTFETYRMQLEKHIIPYFRGKHILLKELRPKDIENYYEYELKQGKSANTVKKYHANIHKALNYAVRQELIPANPSDCLELPKAEKFKGAFYSEEEASKILALAEGTKLEAPIWLAVTLGLRRSEIVGLKWSSVNLEKGTLEIKSTCVLVGTVPKNVDMTKNEASKRTFYLNNDMILFFKRLKRKENEKKLNLGEQYVDSGYVCTDEYGRQLKPDYISQTFSKFIKKNNLKKVRFHDLRHTCASILINRGFQLKDVQEWLGHSDIQTTANIYGHLEDKRKKAMAETMTSLMTG